MSDQGESQEFRLSDEDVQAFAGKLERWAGELAPEEQGMLQLLLGRAEAGGAGRKTGLEKEFTSSASPGDTATEILRPLLHGGATTRMGMLANRQCNWSTWSRGTAP